MPFTHQTTVGTPRIRGIRGLSLVMQRAVVGLCALLSVGTPLDVLAQAPTAWRDTVRQFAMDHFKSPAWGFSHSLRDYALARDMAAADHAVVDDDVLYAASLLHDLGAFPPWADAKRDHQDIGADSVESILNNTGFPMEKIDAVRGAIRTHMYDRNPLGPEALYLHDADALDWLGAIGVARILALVDPQGGKPTGPEVIPMLESNLDKVPSRVLSPAGRALLPMRQAELSSFLTALKHESENLRTL